MSLSQEESLDAYIVSTSSLSTWDFSLLVFFNILAVFGTFGIALSFRAVSSLLINHMDIWRSIYSVVPFQLIVMFVMVVAAKNFRVSMIPRIVKFRTEAVTKFMVQDPDYKKAPSNVKYRLLSSKLNHVADIESVNFSILYNCSLYVGLYLIFSFIVLGQLQPALNFIISSLGSSVVVYLMATASSK